MLTPDFESQTTLRRSPSSRRREPIDEAIPFLRTIYLCWSKENTGWKLTQAPNQACIQKVDEKTSTGRFTITALADQSGCRRAAAESLALAIEKRACARATAGRTTDWLGAGRGGSHMERALCAIAKNPFSIRAVSARLIDFGRLRHIRHH